jgi:hypothetical protein
LFVGTAIGGRLALGGGAVITRPAFSTSWLLGGRRSPSIAGGCKCLYKWCWFLVIIKFNGEVSYFCTN